MKGKGHPGIREMILKHGFRPYLVNGQWDGYTVEYDGGKRALLIGAVEKQMHLMVTEGHWGDVKLKRR